MSCERINNTRCFLKHFFVVGGDGDGQNDITPVTTAVIIFKLRDVCGDNLGPSLGRSSAPKSVSNDRPPPRRHRKQRGLSKNNRSVNLLRAAVCTIDGAQTRHAASAAI